MTKTVETKTTTEISITLRSLFLSRRLGSGVVTFAVGSTMVEITRVLRIAFSELEISYQVSFKTLERAYEFSTTCILTHSLLEHSDQSDIFEPLFRI